MNMRNLAIWAFVGAVVLALMLAMQSNMTAQSMQELTYTELRQGAANGTIKQVTIEGARVTGVLEGGTPFFAKKLETDFDLASHLADQGVNVTAKPASGGFNFGTFISLLFIAMIGFFIYMQYRQMSGGGGGRSELCAEDSQTLRHG